ncbi:MAG: glycoside hydrolase family 3 protein [Lachnospiraceae bacterium]|nr:glycoside hydrolase family 3 protein [Lachnospiraceae bacterium]
MNMKMKKGLGILCLLMMVLLSGSQAEAKEEQLLEEVEEILAGMTLEEKVYQLFIITPEALTGSNTVTAAGETTRKSLENYPVGGLVYFSKNLKDPAQTKKMLQNVMAFSYEVEGLPLFTCIDEEGGRVARIGSNPVFGVEKIGCMQEVEDEKEAYEAGETIGTYLSRLGFNFDFAPDADVLTNKSNKAIGDRSFGSDSDRVVKMAAAFSDGLHSQNVLSSFKHFPGHGAVQGDTHDGFAYTDKTYEELLKSELKPFMAAGSLGVDAVMAAHISVPEITGEDTPCTLSEKMITDVLRRDLGFEGLIITDALDMGAITQNYTSRQAAVLAFRAGVDMLLMPRDFKQASEGILEAVEKGEISEERIDESLRRIIKAKLLWKGH